LTTGYDAGVRLLAVLLSAFAGCSFSPPEGGGMFACSAAEPACPPGTTCIDGRCGVAADAAPSSAFAFRQKITLGDRDRGSLSQFPLLIRLDGKGFDYTAAQADGADLRFYDPDEAPLVHEIEVWEPSGESLVWVELPEASIGSTPDHIWMYYGDPELAAPGDGAEVWSAYQAVYHLGASPADSGPRGLDAVPDGTGRTIGVVGEGNAFDGEGTHMRLPDNPDLLRSVPGMTLEAWVRPCAHEVERVVVAVSSHGSVESRAQFKVTSTGKVRLAFRSDDEQGSLVSLETPGPIPAETWSWVAVVADLPADTVAIYIDGQQIIAADSVGFAERTVETIPDAAFIGIDEEGIEPFEGIIDELRIAGRAMSTEWIAAQYAAMTGALVTLEPPEAL
jgi:hypothetical protein